MEKKYYICDKENYHINRNLQDEQRKEKEL